MELGEIGLIDFSPEIPLTGGFSETGGSPGQADLFTEPSPVISNFGVQELSLTESFGAEQWAPGDEAHYEPASVVEGVLQQGGFDDWLESNAYEAAEESFFSDWLKASLAADTTENDGETPPTKSFFGELFGIEVEEMGGEAEAKEEKLKLGPLYEHHNYALAINFSETSKDRLYITSHTFETREPVVRPTEHEPGHISYQTPVVSMYTEPLPIITRTSWTMGYRVHEYTELRKTNNSSAYVAHLN